MISTIVSSVKGFVQKLVGMDAMSVEHKEQMERLERNHMDDYQKLKEEFGIDRNNDIILRDVLIFTTTMESFIPRYRIIEIDKNN